jgi:hypothetical protein
MPAVSLFYPPFIRENDFMKIILLALWQKKTKKKTKGP